MNKLDEKKYGGILVGRLETGLLGKYDIANQPYVFYYYKVKGNGIVSLSGLGSFSVYLLNLADQATVHLVSSGEMMESSDIVQIENASLALNVKGGYAELLVAGVQRPCFDYSQMKLIRQQNLKYVSKPWGHELWMNGEHPAYAFKQICIKPGYKTSLQYHQFKRETIALFQGEAKLHYHKFNRNLANDDIGPADISNLIISPVTIIDIFPNILHRMEAIDEIVFYEVSTPHLSDVVRVLDDNQRACGKIEQGQGDLR